MYITVPYEGGQFRKFQNGQFLIEHWLIELLEKLLEFFYVNAEQVRIYKILKKLFKAKTTMYRKA